MKKLVIVVAAFAALTFAGGAVAANHYMITNANQIKPSVRQTLRGNQGPQGYTGATGVTGVTGPQGSTGPQGPSGVAGLNTTTVNGTDTYLAPLGDTGDAAYSVATCPAGFAVTGGGWTTATGGVPMDDATVAYNESLGNSWAVIVGNDGPDAADFNATALCVGSASGASTASVRHLTTGQKATLAKQLAAVIAK